jgi:hypothetical protein
MDEIPFCEYIPFFYDTVKSPCINVVNNYNSFWTTLLFCYFVHLIVAIIAILQADLLRKIYSFEDDDEM